MARTSPPGICLPCSTDADGGQPRGVFSERSASAGQRRQSQSRDGRSLGKPRLIVQSGWPALRIDGAMCESAAAAVFFGARLQQDGGVGGLHESPLKHIESSAKRNYTPCELFVSTICENLCEFFTCRRTLPLTPNPGGQEKTASRAAGKGS